MNKKEMLSLAVTLCLLASWNGAEAAAASSGLFRPDYSCSLLSPCSSGVASSRTSAPATPAPISRGLL